jgi:hypothetical protein
MIRQIAGPLAALLPVCHERVSSAVDRISLKGMVLKGVAVRLFIFGKDDEGVGQTLHLRQDS